MVWLTLFLILYFFTNASTLNTLGIAPEEVLISASALYILARSAIKPQTINRANSRLWSELRVPVVIFLFFAFLSCLLSQFGMQEAIRKVITTYIARGILVAVIAILCEDIIEFIRPMKFMMILCISAAAIGIIHFGTTFFRIGVYSGTTFANFYRITLFFNPNMLAMDMLLLCVFAIAFAKISEKRLWLFFALCTVYVVILSKSRTATALLLVPLVYNFYGSGKFHIRHLVFVLIAFLLIGFSKEIVFGIFLKKIEQIHQYGYDIRMLSYIEAWSYFKESPFWGCGCDAFTKLSLANPNILMIIKKIKGVDLLSTRDGLAMHSAYFGILIDFGIFGLASFVLIIYKYYHFLNKQIRLAASPSTRELLVAVKVTFLIFLGGNIFTSFLGRNIYYMVFAIPVIFNRRYQRKIQHVQNEYRYPNQESPDRL